MAELPRRYSEAEAADLLGVSVATLRRQERKGLIRAFRPSERKVYYLDGELRRYMETGGLPCPKSTSASANGSSASGATPMSGADAGSTPILDRHAAQALVNEMLRPRSERSPSGCRPTARSAMPDQSR